LLLFKKKINKSILLKEKSLMAIRFFFFKKTKKIEGLV